MHAVHAWAAPLTRPRVLQAPGSPSGTCSTPSGKHSAAAATRTHSQTCDGGRITTFPAPPARPLATRAGSSASTLSAACSIFDAVAHPRHPASRAASSHSQPSCPSRCLGTSSAPHSTSTTAHLAAQHSAHSRGSSGAVALWMDSAAASADTAACCGAPGAAASRPGLPCRHSCSGDTHSSVSGRRSCDYIRGQRRRTRLHSKPGATHPAENSTLSGCSSAHETPLAEGSGLQTLGLADQTLELPPAAGRRASAAPTSHPVHACLMLTPFSTPESRAPGCSGAGSDTGSVFDEAPVLETLAEGAEAGSTMAVTSRSLRSDGETDMLLFEGPQHASVCAPEPCVATPAPGPQDPASRSSSAERTLSYDPDDMHAHVFRTFENVPAPPPRAAHTPECMSRSSTDLHACSGCVPVELRSQSFRGQPCMHDTISADCSGDVDHSTLCWAAHHGANASSWPSHTCMCA